MPHIKVDIERIREYQRCVSSTQRNVRSISADLLVIGRCLDQEVKNNGDIQRKIQNANDSLLDCEIVLSRMGTFFGDTTLKYMGAERQLFLQENGKSGQSAYTSIDELVTTIAEKEGLRISDVKDAIVSGEYTLNEIISYANGEGGNSGAFAGYIRDLGTAKVSKDSPDYTEEQIEEIADIAANELGMMATDIHEMIRQGLCKTEDIAEFIEGKATQANKFIKDLSDKTSDVAKFVRRVTGASDVLFKIKDGYVIVSKFTRNSYFNKLVKWANEGTGIGTRYRIDKILDKPVIGQVFAVDQVAKNVGKVAEVVGDVANVVSGVVEGVNTVVEVGHKVNDIWADDSLSTKEKIADSSAVVITSVVSTALDVAAPFAGKAVETAISAAIPGAGVVLGWVAGELVEGGMKLVSDVIASEAVVNQVSDSIEKVGDAVTSGVAAVSDAGKKLKESQNVKEAVKNTAALVGTAVVAGTKVVATAVKEAVKTQVVVAKETVKTAVKKVTTTVKKTVETVKTTAKKVANTVKKAATSVKNFFKKW